jgi:hypothetical protein
VTFDEVAGHLRALTQDPDCPNRLDVLLDVTQASSAPTSEQLRAFSNLIAGIRDTVRFDGCAIAACTDVLFGMSRMFEVLAQECFQETHVFRSVDKAEEWLVARRQPAKCMTAGAGFP